MENKVNLISISGKVGSGKDTVGTIIQYLTDPNNSQFDFKTWYASNLYSVYQVGGKYTVKKWADKLKDIVCLLIGCSREDLESQEFKETPLGREWDLYVTTSSYGAPDTISLTPTGAFHESKRQMTPRLMLQLLGTECGRQIIHPQIWVNALFADYKYEHKDFHPVTKEPARSMGYPNWVITDTRFPNEANKVREMGGINIRIIRKHTSEEWQKIYPEVVVLDPDGWNRDSRYQKEWFEDKLTLEEYESKVIRSTCKFESGWKSFTSKHESETALDNWDGFNHTIENDGSIEDLIEVVKKILIKEGVIDG